MINPITIIKILTKLAGVEKKGSPIVKKNSNPTALETVIAIINENKKALIFFTK
jgi:hypothetical protein